GHATPHRAPRRHLALLEILGRPLPLAPPPRPRPCRRPIRLRAPGRQWPDDRQPLGGDAAAVVITADLAAGSEVGARPPSEGGRLLTGDSLPLPIRSPVARHRRPLNH